MLVLRRLLVPYDFSEAAGHAARYACDLATIFRAEVVILYVLPPLRYDFAMAEPSVDQASLVNEQRSANARTARESYMRSLSTPGGVRFEVVEGDPAGEIINAANSGKFDAVVMSTHGAGAFRRWFIIGSVTAKVLHLAEHPVITSPHFDKAPSPLSIHQILCAVDLGPQSQRVLCWAWQAAKRFESRLAVAHAAPPLDDAAIIVEESWKAEVSNQLASRIDDARRELGIEAQTHVEFGPPARVISDLARATRAELVVLGRGASQGLIGRLRANAYDIIRHCECPVVSV